MFSKKQIVYAVKIACFYFDYLIKRIIDATIEGIGIQSVNTP